MLQKLAVVLLCITAGCAPIQPQINLAVAPPVDVQESYLLEQIHRDWAKRMGGVISQWWSWCGAVTRVDSSRWPEHKEITVYSSNHPTKFVFNKLGYDPSLSSITYGKPQVVTTETSLPAHGYIYNLTAETRDGEFKQSDQVTLSQSRSVSITQGVQFDASLSSQTTVGGSYTGVDIEQQITATVGYSSSTEEARAKEESSDRTVTHEFSTPLAAGAVTRIYATAGSSTSTSTMSIDGVAAWGAEVTLGEPCSLSLDWWKHAGSWVIDRYNSPIWDCWGDSFTRQVLRHRRLVGAYLENWWSQSGSTTPCTFPMAVDTASAMFSGQMAEWQGLAGQDTNRGKWLDNAPSGIDDQLAAAQDPANRSIRIHGVQTLQYQSDVVTRVEEIMPDAIDNFLVLGAKECDPRSSTC